MVSPTIICYPLAERAVQEGMLKESNGQTKEAYCCYLSSVLLMVQALKDEVCDEKEIKELCHGESIKLYRLIRQALGEIFGILNDQREAFTGNVIQKEDLSHSTPSNADILSSNNSRKDIDNSKSGLLTVTSSLQRNAENGIGPSHEHRESKVENTLDTSKSSDIISSLGLESLNTDEDSRKGKQYMHVCGACDNKLFPSENLLKVHTNAHSDETLHVCQQSGDGSSLVDINCDKCFNFVCHLNDRAKVLLNDRLYQSKVLLNDRLYHCEVCLKSFNSLSALKTHVVNHTGEKTYRCDQCDKVFNHKNNFRRHIKIHTGEKIHECPVCKKAFVQLAELKQHSVVHTGEKPFKCDQCERVFAQKRNFQRHLWVHASVKPYQCQICNKGFILKTQLQKHSLYHVGEKAEHSEIK